VSERSRRSAIRGLLGKRLTAVRLFRVEVEVMADIRVLSLTGDTVATHTLAEVPST
jgi:hypothetical protein